MNNTNGHKRPERSDDNDDDVSDYNSQNIKRIRLSQTSSPPEIVSSSDLSASDEENKDIKVKEKKYESNDDIKSDTEEQLKSDDDKDADENRIKTSSSNSSSASSSDSDSDSDSTLRSESEAELENGLPSALRRELEETLPESDDNNSDDDDVDDDKHTKKTQKSKHAGIKKIKIPNIYESSNLEVLSGGQLKFSKGRNSTSGVIKIDNSIVPKLKRKYAKLNQFKQPTNISQASYKSPDEVLTDNYKFEANELVYLSRQEIKNYTKVELPSEEITNSIHYYVAHRIKEKLELSDEDFNTNYAKFLDGSALLAISSLFTKWVEDLAGKSTFKGYMETVTDDKNARLSSIDEFIRVYDEDISESDDSEGSNESDDSENYINSYSRQSSAFSVGTKTEDESNLSSDDEVLAPVRVG